MSSTKSTYQVSSSLPDLLMQSAEAHEISTEPGTVDELLSGEASMHFPEPRNRRREDDPEDEVQRLRSILHALDKGEPFPDGGVTPTQKDLLCGFYKQF